MHLHALGLVGPFVVNKTGNTVLKEKFSTVDLLLLINLAELLLYPSKFIHIFIKRAALIRR